MMTTPPYPALIGVGGGVGGFVGWATPTWQGFRC